MLYDLCQELSLAVDVKFLFHSQPCDYRPTMFFLCDRVVVNLASSMVSMEETGHLADTRAYGQGRQRDVDSSGHLAHG